MISLQGRERARGTDKDLRDHGWFVFMVPRDNPELAGVVFAEHSEHGYLAAPIAKHVIETYYAEKEGRPLPTLKPPTPPVTSRHSGASRECGGRGRSGAVTRMMRVSFQLSVASSKGPSGHFRQPGF